MNQTSVKRSEIIRRLKDCVDSQDWEPAIQMLAALKAADEAQMFIGLSRKRQLEFLPQLGDEHLAKILENLPKQEAISLSRAADTSTLSHTLDLVSPDLAADVLHGLSRLDSQQVLAGMEDQDPVSSLLPYADDSAGGLMTTEYSSLDPRMTVSEALNLLRESQPPRETIDVLYVVDDSQHLLGRITLRQLVLADPDDRIGDIMEVDVISVAGDADREASTRIIDHYHLSSLPVVDREGSVVGSIRLQDSIKVAEQEATEDMYRMIGLTEQERISGPLKESLKQRLPWLVLNLATAVLAGFVVSLFSSTIAQAVALAAFLPIIAGQTANAATQTGTIIVRSLALGEIPSGNEKKAVLKEVTLAAANGLVVALIAGVIALGFLDAEDLWLAPVMAGAMFLGMIVAGLSGASIPLLLRLLRIDPALASTVVITTVTDVVGFVLLLGSAAMALRYVS